MIDLGTGNNNKINWPMSDKQELIDIVEVVYRSVDAYCAIGIKKRDAYCASRLLMHMVSRACLVLLPWSAFLPRCLVSDARRGSGRAAGGGA